MALHSSSAPSHSLATLLFSRNALRRLGRVKARGSDGRKGFDCVPPEDKLQCIRLVRAILQGTWKEISDWSILDVKSLFDLLPGVHQQVRHDAGSAAVG